MEITRCGWTVQPVTCFPNKMNNKTAVVLRVWAGPPEAGRNIQHIHNQTCRHNTVITGTHKAACVVDVAMFRSGGGWGGGVIWRNHRPMQRHPTHYKATYITALFLNFTELWFLVVYWHIWGMRTPCFQTVKHIFYVTQWYTKHSLPYYKRVHLHHSYARRVKLWTL
jgi:hypothetical protein